MDTHQTLCCWRELMVKASHFQWPLFWPRANMSLMWLKDFPVFALLRYCTCRGTVKCNAVCLCAAWQPAGTAPRANCNCTVCVLSWVSLPVCVCVCVGSSRCIGSSCHSLINSTFRLITVEGEHVSPGIRSWVLHAVCICLCVSKHNSQREQVSGCTGTCVVYLFAVHTQRERNK